MRLWRPLRHAYVLIVVMVGWVFFRAETLPAAIGFLEAMAGARAVTPGIYTLGWYLTPDVSIALVAGAIGSTPIVPALAAWHDRVADGGRRLALAFSPASTAALAAAARRVDHADRRAHLQPVHLFPILMNRTLIVLFVAIIDAPAGGHAGRHGRRRSRGREPRTRGVPALGRHVDVGQGLSRRVHGVVRRPFRISRRSRALVRREPPLRPRRVAVERGRSRARTSGSTTGTMAAWSTTRTRRR